MAMRWTAVFGACALVSAGACGDDGAAGDATGATDAAGDTSAGDTTATDTHVDGAGDVPSDGSAPTDGTTTTTDTQGDTTVSGAPTLTGVEAHVAGSRGFDLDLALTGADAQRDVQLARVRVFDAGGAPVLAFFQGLSQAPDSHEGLFALTTPVAGQATFVANVRLRGLYGEHPTIAKVEVALRDAAGNTSADVEADVIAQVVVNVGDACDPDLVDSRCPQGMGCRGTPAQCQEGIAPEATRVAYLKGEGGTRILALGTEPEDDLTAVRIEFLDNAGQALAVDLDNDGSPESTEFELDATGKAVDGAFLVRLDPAAGFEAVVPQVALTPRDGAGHVGARKTTRLANAPVRAVGQGCDVYGFDVCNATAVCSPGVPGASNTCKAKSALGPAECAAAPVLTPDTGATATSGLATGPSIWDAPTGCSAGDPTGRPEAVVVVRLTNLAKKLTLTTALPGTNFDTVLYVLPGCGATGAVALGCADDAPEGSAAASLVLDNVPAGDYLVVVDSWSPEGGAFALEVSVE